MSARCGFCGWPPDECACGPAVKQADTATLFGGETYEPDQDAKRLMGLLGRVYALMADGQWRGLAEIALGAGGTEASVSARLRDLRKPKFGEHTVLRRRVAGGLHHYRLET